MRAQKNRKDDASAQVSGIVKLIICAANTNAPVTPINGTFRSSLSVRTFFAQ